MDRRGAPLLALALALAGCGGGGNGAAGDRIASAAAKTAKVGSIEADFRISGAGVSGEGSGVFNTDKKGSGQLTMTVVVNGRSVKIDTVITGTVLYMRSPAFAQLTGGKQWVMLDLGKIARQRGIDLGSLLNTSPTPTSALAYLRGSGGKIDKLGEERVRGVKTTHYHTTVDLSRAAARAQGTARQALRRVVKTSGVKDVPVDVWIDDDGYVRKVTYETNSTGGRSAQVTMELHDFGKHITINAPPRQSVVDLMSRLGGG
jgi:LppX_LprAFG lipoprotein